VSLPNLETIKRQREKLHVSQKKLASMTGVSTSMINQGAAEFIYAGF